MLLEKQSFWSHICAEALTTPNAADILAPFFIGLAHQSTGAAQKKLASESATNFTYGPHCIVIRAFVIEIALWGNNIFKNWATWNN